MISSTRPAPQCCCHTRNVSVVVSRNTVMLVCRGELVYTVVNTSSCLTFLTQAHCGPKVEQRFASCLGHTLQPFRYPVCLTERCSLVCRNLCRDFGFRATKGVEKRDILRYPTFVRRRLLAPCKQNLPKRKTCI